MEEKKKVILELFQNPGYRPMKLKELAVFLDVPRERREELREVLDQLLAEGRISLSKRGKYARAGSFVVEGIFHATQKAFGFVTVEGEPQDIYIAEGNTLNAMDRDRVQVSVLSQGDGDRRPEGKIVRILSRELKTVVGVFEKSRGYGFLVPDEKRIHTDIFIPAGKDMGAVDGHKAVARIISYGDERHKPEGEIIEILGHVNDPGVDILSVIRAYDLPVEFPEEVMKQAAQVAGPVSEKDRAGRRDLRDLTTVTIDGEDAKDLDDAITLWKEGEIYHLGVHIADVSHYVREGTPLDQEALRRGTSVYLVDRVIPMLPHVLSNGICSLNEGEDRLALSCLMDVDSSGMVVGHSIDETVIRSDRRMTYTKVNQILTGDPEARKEYEAYVPMFLLMEELSALMRKKRKGRGALDFDFPESKIILDGAGHPVDIRPYERNTATRIIEDFMLAANETIAEDFFWQEIPFLYRTHEVPDPDKIRQLALFIRNFGYGIKGVQTEIHPKELQKLLSRIEDSPEEGLISRLTLRSLKRARYSTECSGHFGLAAKYYCHFTSPIRRYPDLQIHRIIKENLEGRLDEERRAHYEEILPEVARASSDRERKADEAERETEKAKKAEYMARRLGQSYEGVISSVTSWGIYVELENTVEGLIHVTDMLDDYYMFDEASYEMRGERTGRVFRLGQRISVTVKEVDQAAKTIYFQMEEEENDGEGQF